MYLLRQGILQSKRDISLLFVSQTIPTTSNRVHRTKLSCVILKFKFATRVFVTAICRHVFVIVYVIIKSRKVEQTWGDYIAFICIVYWIIYISTKEVVLNIWAINYTNKYAWLVDKINKIWSNHSRAVRARPHNNTKKTWQPFTHLCWSN